MVKEDPDRRWSQPPANTRHRGLTFQLAALALAVGSLSATGFLTLHWFQKPEAGSGGGKPPAAPPPSRLFRLWPRDRQPDLVLLLSGETFGYLQPCGCSPIQYGGLERRHQFLNTLVQQRHWPVVALDLGDVAQKNGPQALIKYRYSMEALKLLDYSGVGIGRNEMLMPLIDALSDFALNNPNPPVLATNVLNAETQFPGMLKPTAVVERKGAPRVGVISAVAPSVAGQITDPTVRFAALETAVPAGLKQLQTQRAELPVLLLQGSVKEAQECAVKFPQIPVILCSTAQDEPPDTPDRAGNTLLINVGHKGRYLGLVGVYRTGKNNPAFDLHYQLAHLGPEYQTPAGLDASNPVLGLLEKYTQEVKTGNYLAQFSKTDHPIQREYKGATFVGSEKCQRCHKEAFKIWKNSPHSRAYDTLVKAKRPSLRQYDGECVVCHVTGFGYNGGFADEKTTPHLKENGCENCHGPGSVHVKGNVEPKLLALMNPFKTKLNETEEEKTSRTNRLNFSCQKCHDIDNDVHWDIKKWVEGKIIHP